MPTVKLYANLRKLVGTKELPIMGETIGEVVDKLVRQKPAVGALILQEGEIVPHVVVTLNGHATMDLETPVSEQDVVAIFPPIAGGVM